MFAEVHGQLDRAETLASDPAFLNLSGFFSENASLQYLDFCHTTEEANGRIAAVLVGKLIEIVDKSPEGQHSAALKPCCHRFDRARGLNDNQQ